MNHTSAAFPTKGNKINATNSRLIFPDSVKPPILSTKNSAVKPVMAVTRASRQSAAIGFSFWCSSPSTVVLLSLEELLELLLELEELRERLEPVVSECPWMVNEGSEGRWGIRKTRP